MPETRYCPDCAVAPGQEHQEGCDVERCTHCCFQWISCGCVEHDPALAIWTGRWPGEVTCLKHDLVMRGTDGTVMPDLNALAMATAQAPLDDPLRRWVVLETEAWRENP